MRNEEENGRHTQSTGGVRRTVCFDEEVLPIGIEEAGFLYMAEGGGGVIVYS